MFTSQRKNTRKTLTKSTAKLSQTGRKRAESTSIGMSARFREQRQMEEVREFTEDLPSNVLVSLPPTYSHGELLKDVNYLNSIYNHILVMISSHLTTQTDSKNYQMVKMSRQIQTIIMENVRIKGQIDAKYRSMTDLQQLAQYSNKTSAQLLTGEKLNNLLHDFQEKEKEAEYLSKKVRQLQACIPLKHGEVSNTKIQQKQKRCKALRKMIDKQNQRISKLQQQQKALLKKLYATQHQIIKNEQSSSTIKLKLRQAQSEKRIRSKTRQTKPQNKQNLSLWNKQKQIKNVRILSTTQKVKLPRYKLL